MPNFIVRLTDKKTKIDYYVNWSTIVDAPTSEPFTFAKAKKEIIKNFGRKVEAHRAIESLTTKGVSSPYEDLKDVLWCSGYSMKQLLNDFCRPFEKKFLN